MAGLSAFLGRLVRLDPQAITRLRTLFPEWRFGQLVANLTTAAGCQDVESLWDVEDEQLLAAAQLHLRQRTPPEAASSGRTERGN